MLLSITCSHLDGVLFLARRVGSWLAPHPHMSNFKLFDDFENGDS